MASVALAATGGARHHDMTADVVVDLLWALAEPDSGLEHVRAATSPGRVDVILFSIAENALSAAEAGARLCELATTTAPQFEGWRIVHD
ncbi:hypothetical protein SAMN05421504_113101 [Amycolatopsis xylanica]|uniref:Uncharacterized protein n=1 Tax=Amycolatopsis xylanica TaxID=589385 RepID=A0A1H3SCR4_9PSEU|nr:hypothetical protein [Amycolatopsis xylanica]SDZ35341.1 hypothetical protein SAMN05421504_113101 [Amycolatopsis xylanica]